MYEEPVYRVLQPGETSPAYSMEIFYKYYYKKTYDKDNN